MTAVGDVIEVDVTAVANGGHCVGRLASGQVVFVRHTLPGERIRARITAVGKGGRFLNADAIDVIVSSPHRITPACQWAGLCGGCDFQHADAAFAGQMKREVVSDLVRRLGHIEAVHGVPTADAVEWIAMPHGIGGSGSRSRVRYVVNSDGVLSMRAHHSHDLVPVGACPLGLPQVTAAATGYHGIAGSDVEFVVDDDAEVVTVVNGVANDLVTRRVGDRSWRLQATGFWQVHPDAASTMSALLTDLVQPRPAEHVLDLYAGAGLFAAAMAPHVGEHGRVDAVESSESSVHDGATALADMPQVMFHHADVRRWLKETRGATADVVIMDPPRAGVGADAMVDICQLRPRVLAYVSCDPATFARDAAVASTQGYHLTRIVAIDLFPMTGHVELIAIFRPGSHTCPGACD